MRVADYLRLAAREARRTRGRIVLFVACIALGVAAVVVVSAMSAGIDSGVRGEGRRLLAADVAVEGWRPIPAELSTIVGTSAAARADVRTFSSVVLGPDASRTQLSEIKVVEAGYPFYGTLRLDPDRPIAELLAPDATVVAPELLSRLGAKVGDSLSIGGVKFRVAGTVVEEPDKLGATFSPGPRVFLSPEGVGRTSLLARGARIEHRTLLKLPDGATSADATRLAERLRASLPDAAFYQVRTFHEAQPALRRSIARIGDYLGLVGLLSLLVGGLGVAQVSRAWLSGRMDDIAVLRCLGATPRQVVTLYTTAVLAASLLASLSGCAIGAALHGSLPRLFAGLIPPDVIGPLPASAVARGLALGMSVSLVFTLPSLIALRKVPPARVIQRGAEPVAEGPIARAAAGSLVVGAAWAAAWVQSGSLMVGAIFAFGLLAAALLLWATAAAISRIARLVPRGAGAVGVRVRHGLAHLARPGTATVGSIVALGLGVTFVFATRLIERHLTEQLRAELPPDAPSTFFLDVQPDEWEGLRKLITQEGGTNVDARPMITTRFAAVDGVPVADLAARIPDDDAPAGGSQRSDARLGIGDRARKWALTREQRVTYGPSLPRGNRVIEGTFPSGRGGVSVEENFAKQLGLHVGSVLSLDVQGVPLDLPVTSIRTVDWRTFGINFTLFVEPGPLEAAPQQRIAVARFPQRDLSTAGAGVARAYPNVTMIHVRDVIDKVLGVLDHLALAVRSLGWFIVAAGAVVLGGTVTATQARRAREVALLKAVGMTRRDVVTVFALEYALTGSVAALGGVGFGSALGWAVVTRVLSIPWAPRATEAAAAAGIAVALSVVAGLVASARALSARPAEVLRSE